MGRRLLRVLVPLEGPGLASARVMSPSLWTMTVHKVVSLHAVDGRAASSTRSWSTSSTHVPAVDAADGARDTAVAERDDDGRTASSTTELSTSSTARLVAVPGRGVGAKVNITMAMFRVTRAYCCKDFTKLATMRLPLLVMMLSG